MQIRILAVEDDPDIARLLSLELGRLGYSLRTVGTAAQAAAELRMSAPSLVLLDLGLPDRDGADLLRELRAGGAAIPVICLTARDKPVERVGGLRAGADDYIVKPFAPEEMAARVRAICRRSAGSASARIRVGEVEVDLVARCAWLDDERIELTSREWSVLEALVLRPGRIVTKGELERLVLGFESELASNAIEVHVSSLRKKLGRELVETVRGMGYRVGAPA